MISTVGVKYNTDFLNQHWLVINRRLLCPNIFAQTNDDLFIDSIYISLQWRHNECGSVSNHQTHGCLLNRLFRRWSKKTSKLRVTELCAGNSPGPVNSPHKWPVTRKMFPFDDVIMWSHHGVNIYTKFRTRLSVNIRWQHGKGKAVFWPRHNE